MGGKAQGETTRKRSSLSKVSIRSQNPGLSRGKETFSKRENEEGNREGGTEWGGGPVFSGGNSSATKGCREPPRGGGGSSYRKEDRPEKGIGGAERTGAGYRSTGTTIQHLLSRTVLLEGWGAPESCKKEEKVLGGGGTYTFVSRGIDCYRADRGLEREGRGGGKSQTLQKRGEKRERLKEAVILVEPKGGGREPPMIG